MAERAKSILVLGGGVSGAAAAELASSIGFVPVTVSGDKPLPDGEFSLAVASPGVALTHRWMSQCRERSIPVVSELQFGCEELRRRGWKLLAVTGSKGKSSVVKVVADAINLSGSRAVACGNYGLAVSEVALSPDPGWAVVEVSSFMMETTDLDEGAFEAAAIINLQEDHLDRHGSLEVYHSLKLKLLGMAKNCGYSFNSDPVKHLFAGSWFDNGVLSGNAAAGVFLMRAAGVGDDDIRRAFMSFSPLPHRMNKIASIDGVDFIDDSKATSLRALAAGVEMCGSNVRLIAGGRAKGDDPNSVAGVLTARVKKVYIIGECADAFFSSWSGSVDCEICQTMQRAVETARREAVKGDTVLLSPGTASFDQYANFNERGEAFADLVKKGKKT